MNGSGVYILIAMKMRNVLYFFGTDNNNSDRIEKKQNRKCGGLVFEARYLNVVIRSSS